MKKWRRQKENGKHNIINNGINILNLMDTGSITTARAKAFNDIRKENDDGLLVMPTNECTTRSVKTVSGLSAQWTQKEMNEEKKNGNGEITVSNFEIYAHLFISEDYHWWCYGLEGASVLVLVCVGCWLLEELYCCEFNVDNICK